MDDGLLCTIRDGKLDLVDKEDFLEFTVELTSEVREDLEKIQALNGFTDIETTLLQCAFKSLKHFKETGELP